MTWDRLQQLIRILLYMIGGMFLDDAILNGELFEAAVSGVVSIAAFIWWYKWDRNREAT